MENSHLESALTTLYFEKCSRELALLWVNQWPLFQKWNNHFINIQMEIGYSGKFQKIILLFSFWNKVNRKHPK